MKCSARVKLASWCSVVAGVCRDRADVLLVCCVGVLVPWCEQECVKITLDNHGGGWYPWWWFDHSKHKGASNKPPSGVKSVFEKQYGECKPTDPYCFGRLPKWTDEFASELLACSAKDCKSGDVYKWLFQPDNSVAHGSYMAMKHHVKVNNGELRNTGQSWNPAVIMGQKTSASMDSVQFYKSKGGVWSFMLDDDNCYCQTALEMGGRMCQGNDQPTFGVDMDDRSCGQPSTGKSLFLYTRNIAKKDLTNAHRGKKWGTGWKQWWSFTNQDGRQRDMLGRQWKAGSFGVPDQCIYAPDGIKGAMVTTCNGQMPQNLQEKSTELMAIDSRGTTYKWQFSKMNTISSAVYKAFTKGYG